MDQPLRIEKLANEVTMTWIQVCVCVCWIVWGRDRPCRKRWHGSVRIKKLANELTMALLCVLCVCVYVCVRVCVCICVCWIVPDRPQHWNSPLRIEKMKRITLRGCLCTNYAKLDINPKNSTHFQMQFHKFTAFFWLPSWSCPRQSHPKSANELSTQFKIPYT
jgi:hypothetical protein